MQMQTVLQASHRALPVAQGRELLSAAATSFGSWGVADPPSCYILALAFELGVQPRSNAEWISAGSSVRRRWWMCLTDTWYDLGCVRARA